jgi:hypothetical protein
MDVDAVTMCQLPLRKHTERGCRASAHVASTTFKRLVNKVARLVSLTTSGVQSSAFLSLPLR